MSVIMCGLEVLNSFAKLRLFICNCSGKYMSVRRTFVVAAIVRRGCAGIRLVRVVYKHICCVMASGAIPIEQSPGIMFSRYVRTCGAPTYI
eukprot:359435-Chlamydomonas_euryale.AAC.2